MHKFFSKPLLLLVLAALFSVLLAAPACSEETQSKTVPLPKHGSLELTFPKPWRSDVAQPPGEVPPLVMLQPEKGDDFRVMISPIWDPLGKHNMGGDAQAKAAAELVRKETAPSAVEKELVLKEIKGPAAHGFYFFATDKAPNPGDYPYETAAVVGLGDVLLNVTILHRTKGAPEIDQAIAMLAAAKHVKPADK